MKPANTCLILGAGASKPYGYPLGPELSKAIIDLGMQGKDYWAEKEKLLQVKDWAITVATKFAKCRLSKPTMTIDEFLDRQYPGIEQRAPGDNPEWNEFSTAKMLICDIIRRCEQPQKGVLDWYQLLFEHLERSVTAECPWQLRIITFNYDRSLEFYLARYHAMKTGLLQQETRRWLLERVSFAHVYGDVGPLPDGQPKRDEFAPEYGVWRGGEFWKGREKIEIIRALDPNPDSSGRYRSWIANAEYVIVLGFGYDKMNCSRLGLSENLPEKCVFTTAYDRDMHPQIEDLLSGCGYYLGLPGEDCYSFLLRTEVLTWALNGLPAVELLARLNGKNGGTMKTA